MNLEYAVDRLYGAGWLPDERMELERLADGRWYPSIPAAQREFLAVGLELSIKYIQAFNCYRASWTPADNQNKPAAIEDGTVIGACAEEAAVYAMAQLRAAMIEQREIAQAA